MEPILTHVIPQLDWGDNSYQLSQLMASLAGEGIRSRVVTFHPSVLTHNALQEFDSDACVCRIRGGLDVPGYWKLAKALRDAPVVHWWGDSSLAAHWLQRLGVFLTHQWATDMERDASNDHGPDPWPAGTVAVSIGLLDCKATDEPGQIDCGYPVPQRDRIADHGQWGEVDFRGELGVPSDCRLIGTAGALAPNSSMTDVIWAADLLKVVRDDVHLVILGDGPERWRWEHFTECVQITDRVHFWNDGEYACQRIGELDCYWDAGRAPRLGWGAQVAIAAGVPVVAARVGEKRALFPHDHPAAETTLIEVGDRAELARCTMRILDDQEFAARISQQLRERLFRSDHDDCEGTAMDAYSAYRDQVTSILGHKSGIMPGLGHL